MYESITNEEKQKLNDLKMKGGDEMAKKEKDISTSEKKESTKKISITEQRDKIANEALAFIEEKVDDKNEVRKIHSRMYRILISK